MERPLARYVRFLNEKTPSGKQKKEYPAKIADLQEGDSIFLDPSVDTPDKIANANSILAKKGLCIANYRKEIADEETGEYTVYYFVGKPLPECDW